MDRRAVKRAMRTLTDIVFLVLRPLGPWVVTVSTPRALDTACCKILDVKPRPMRQRARAGTYLVEEGIRRHALGEGQTCGATARATTASTGSGVISSSPRSLPRSL